MTHKILEQVTNDIIKRSEGSRSDYLQRMKKMAEDMPRRNMLSCGNLAHGFAGCRAQDKEDLKAKEKPNIAIVSAYNDMLSAHQPYKNFPDIIKEAAREAGATAQFAGGVPAMCDGVTQGQIGMELSLFSRDVIAMSTAIALSHNMFDGVLCLGICDKIVPGLLIGSLSFGYLPVTFVPGGPMPSGSPHREKTKIRKLFAEGKVSEEELLEAEAKTYHAPGTCTFYGTANSNQMLMEIMGLQLPGSSFINPNTDLRHQLTKESTKNSINNSKLLNKYNPLHNILDERSIVNGIVGLLATGGSTNHTIHLIAIAKAAGIKINWDDFSKLSEIVPLMTRIYPNGDADVNDFHNAGGMAFLIKELLNAGLLNKEVKTINGEGLEGYCRTPELDKNEITWKDSVQNSGDTEVLSPISEPFKPDGGLKLLTGNLGRAIIKTSALKEEQYVTEAPAKVFLSQQELEQNFKEGKLNEDFIAVILFQGPRANGMPELHKLTPNLSVLQDLGFKVGLVTDGRMSGASGRVPAAIHVTPECAKAGPLALVQTGDIIRIDATKGTLEVKLSDEELNNRRIEYPESLMDNETGVGRELFAQMRGIVSDAEDGASFIT